ncbi:hypothetical protein [Paenibacillus bovis]|uniref:Uncharacterized protein n=1 Tax=Paenibacillus bovis TaxID=1616788 RepID=A0A1X9T405_9BACL|nr:hypothetical protein [Paenibacillus bovis]ARR10663.1 hypothetical protein AR543_p0055 [Paenibacillus bovis]
MTSQLERLNDMVVTQCRVWGPHIEYILVSNCVANVDTLFALGLSVNEISRIQEYAKALFTENVLEISATAFKYTNAKWFDPNRNQFVEYGYEERFQSHYNPFAELITEEERRQLPADTQQLLSLMTSYFALVDFVTEERERVAESKKHAADPYTNDLLLLRENTNVFDHNIHRLSYLMQPIHTYLNRDRNGKPVPKEDEHIIRCLLESYLQMSEVLLQPGLYHAPVKHHLQRESEVAAFLKQLD